MYPPDNVDRSRASANCAGSYLHSTWWAQQAYAQTYAMPGQFGLLNGLGSQQGLGGLMGSNSGQGFWSAMKPSWWP